ncbi:hypothetical protein ACFSSC_06795 [Corynebacterium mendelii]|uniref:hypothetical protein n=1 Tax=Corynebacterium mendelii TaxID=2765362 RepID=UPI001A92E329|nr:hypothetical protein [Corynebacterium mendelii]
MAAVLGGAALLAAPIAGPAAALAADNTAGTGTCLPIDGAQKVEGSAAITYVLNGEPGTAAPPGELVEPGRANNDTFVPQLPPRTVDSTVVWHNANNGETKPWYELSGIILPATVRGDSEWVLNQIHFTGQNTAEVTGVPFGKGAPLGAGIGRTTLATMNRAPAGPDDIKREGQSEIKLVNPKATSTYDPGIIIKTITLVMDAPPFCDDQLTDNPDNGDSATGQPADDTTSAPGKNESTGSVVVAILGVLTLVGAVVGGWLSGIFGRL